MLRAGECGIVVDFGNVIEPDVNAKVSRLARRVAQEHIPAVREVIPTYRSLFVAFDPWVQTRTEVEDILKNLLADNVANKFADLRRIVHIPACYGGEFGPDLDFVAEHNGLTAEQVITIHSSTAYLVYMLGFTPGFPYLGGLSEKIAAPRLATPRTLIPAGSVGIAGSQTGFYPIASPGGWRLIARTPVKAFDPNADQPFLFAAGDYLRFDPISPHEFLFIESAVAAGNFRPNIELADGQEDTAL